MTVQAERLAQERRRRAIPALLYSAARRGKSEARKAGGDWDKARAAQFMAGGGIEDVVRQTLAVAVRQAQASIAALEENPGMPPGERAQNLASLTDAYNKPIAASRRVMPETDRLAVAMDAIRRFASAAGPEGKPWAPLAGGTVTARYRKMLAEMRGRKGCRKKGRQPEQARRGAGG